ncbi:MAG TPA: hypothetical protein VF297_31965 [Pyrinomonadaceae bacterium]
MRMSRVGKLLVLLLLSVVTFTDGRAGARAQRERGKPFDKSITTVAGELTIRETDETCAFEVRLAGKLLLKTDCQDEKNPYAGTPLPVIYSYFPGDQIEPFDEVVLLQFNMFGNACNGGPLHFLGLKEDGTYQLSDEIDFCGGHRPVVTWGGNKATVLLPGGPPNRGTGYIPSEIWVYQGGKVRRLTTKARRR